MSVLTQKGRAYMNLAILSIFNQVKAVTGALNVSDTFQVQNTCSMYKITISHGFTTVYLKYCSVWIKSSAEKKILRIPYYAK